MKAVIFPEVNDHFDNIPMQTTSAVYYGQQHKWSVSCWHLSFWERIRLLFTGYIWTMRTDRVAIPTIDRDDIISSNNVNAMQ